MQLDSIWVILVLISLFLYPITTRESGDTNWDYLEVERTKRLWEGIKPSRKKKIERYFSYLYFKAKRIKNGLTKFIIRLYSIVTSLRAWIYAKGNTKTKRS